MKNVKSERIYYKTSNLNLATTLYTLNIPIDGIYAQENSDIVEFYFERNPKLEKTVDDFFSRRLKVEPYTLLINRREILNRIKSEKNTAKFDKTAPKDDIQG